MLFWFVATALVAMWFTFRDPAIDHRMVALGALVPDAFDFLVSGIASGFAGSGATGFEAIEIEAGLAHALITPVVVLIAVMLLTLGRRHVRRRWLMLPIGMFWHLVFDGVWASPALFGWPLSGEALYDQALPLAQRGLLTNVIFEVVGLLLLAWLWRTWGLKDQTERALFWRNGRLNNSLPSL